MSSDPLVIDVSFWRKGDRAWEQARKEQWPMVEHALTTLQFKTKKAINIIKRYYFKGELPDWQAVNKTWLFDDDRARHLDITTLLWLHPSDDYAVLKTLRDAYLKGFGRVYRDVLAGMHFLLDWGVFISSRNGNGRAEFEPSTPAFAGKGKLLFDVIYYDMNDLYFKFGTKKTKHKIAGPGLDSLEYSGRWLVYEQMNMQGSQMLLQYDYPLELMFRNINSDPRDLTLEFGRRQFVYEEVLYRIFHFDTVKEGDTPRTTFVTKVRKILDEGDHLPELKQLWENIKTGKITVKNPWEL